MQYRTMPGTGERVSVLGFGAMRLPLRNPKDPKSVDEETATAMLRRAVEGGVNYVDTAYVYHGGESETWLGRALQGGMREKVFLATKLPTWNVKAHADMDRLLDEQLGRLQTDRIDFYLIHSLNRSLWAKMKDLDFGAFLARARERGRIVHAGFSFHGDRENFKEIVDGHDWAFCQIMYNYLDEHFQAGREGLEHAAARGLGVVVMEPLRGGRIAANVPPAIQAIWDAAPVRRSPVAWALRWVWDHEAVSVVLSGMSAPAHVEENLAVADRGLAGTLTAEERAVVERVKEAYRSRIPVPCTTCGYCLPCPSGVDIPGCFSAYNNAHLFDTLEASRRMYPMMVQKESRASRCTACGECLETCPQEIPIPDRLKDVVKAFEAE